MASQAQVAANQANAQHSTGPRTAAGKANSSRNHTSHGLSSREFVIDPGQEQEFDDFMTQLRATIQPAGAVESGLFTQLAHASWTARRCRRAEVQLQETSYYPHLDCMIVSDTAERHRNIDLYARRAERAYHKALKEIKALQAARLFNADLAAVPVLAVAVAPVEPCPMAEQQALQKHRTLLLRAEAARREVEAIRGIEAAIAPPAQPASHQLEHSNPIPPQSVQPARARRASAG
ncbi:MAG: hypothetical protein HY858_16220 [Candidatus Solibacter usitatus]|nr:hypothetical protein [Candidatus Solibacter usitatus]